MKVRKSVAVAALALAALSVTACGKSSNTPAAGASSPAAAAMSPDEAKATLLAAALKTATTTYKMSITTDSGPAGAGTMEGVADGKNKRIQMTMHIQGQTMDARLIGTDMYIKGMPTMPDKWLHMDMSMLPGGADAFGATEQSFALLNGITEVTANADGSFSGKADPNVALSKATGAQKDSLEKVVKAAKGQPLPFTATVKDGWLTDYSSTMPIEQNGLTITSKVTMHLSDFGQPVTVEAPAPADVVDVSNLGK